MAVYFSSMKDIVKGNRNSISPVALFINVCRDINCFLETYPHMMLLILISAITAPHIHKHCGICIAGNNLNKDTATKMRSATVSSWLPNLLALFVFLAIVPSTISLNPQKRYIYKMPRKRQERTAIKYCREYDKQ